MRMLPSVSLEARQLLPTGWDIAAAALILGFVVLIAEASRDLGHPLSTANASQLQLDVRYLPGYALRTGLRMLIAMGFSLAFTFSYATWAAKNSRAEKLLIPLLDLLQSLPVLSFISVTVVFFLSLAPGRILGAEFVAIFVIFTSQAWNMAFSFYQSLRTVPEELVEAGRVFGLSSWARFWRIEVPFAMPALIWNMMMSMSGSWFLLTASEAFSVGHSNIALPGIGSYIATAIKEQNLSAIFYSIVAMAAVILIYDQILFRPLVVWADRFKIDSEHAEYIPESWALRMYRRAALFRYIIAPINIAIQWSYQVRLPKRLSLNISRSKSQENIANLCWYVALSLIAGYGVWKAYIFLGEDLSWTEVGTAVGLGAITLCRVLLLIALASIVWTPIGIYVGLRPRVVRIVQPLAQFLSAFPANLLFPLAVSLIVTYGLNADIWLSPLMVLGTQWYILFNVIAGASAMPQEIRDVGASFCVRGWLWWKRVALPAVFPYYVTGALTASGGSWNAAFVAEVVSWGRRTLHAHGLGAYLADAVAAGNYQHIVLGTLVMSGFVLLLNRTLWRPLYSFAERKYRLT